MPWELLFFSKMQKRTFSVSSKRTLSVSLDSVFPVAFGLFPLGPVHCLRDSQVRNLANFALKLGLTVLFTHLKIILLQCFQ